jgi:hypothetical protein
MSTDTPDKGPRSDVKTTFVDVVHKESEGSIIVRKEDGSTESMLTQAPEVNKGHRGVIIEAGGTRLFIREPYDS